MWCTFPYRNGGEALTGVIGGQVQMMIDAVPAMAPNVGEEPKVGIHWRLSRSRSAVLHPRMVRPPPSAGAPGYEATTSRR